VCHHKVSGVLQIFIRNFILSFIIRIPNTHTQTHTGSSSIVLVNMYYVLFWYACILIRANIICWYIFMATESFVTPFHVVKFCDVPSCVFDKLGCAVGEKRLCNTNLDVHTDQFSKIISKCSNLKHCYFTYYTLWNYWINICWVNISVDFVQTRYLTWLLGIYSYYNSNSIIFKTAWIPNISTNIVSYI
jgi:hypothetical protein